MGILLFWAAGIYPIDAAETSVDFKRKGELFTESFTGPDGLDAKVTLRCNGTASGGTGGWSLAAVNGSCLTGLPILPEHVELTATPIDRSDGTNPKHYRTTADSGITGETGDDMFRIDPGAKGFFEYGKIAEDAKERAIHITRNGGKPLGLMMPSGLAANGYQDYLTFVKNAPDFVRIEEACTPLTLNVCDGALPTRPVCGEAQGQGYEDLASILPEYQCEAGLASTVSENGSGEFTWSCASGTEFENCSAHKTTNAVCGRAQGRTYSRNPPPKRDQCSVGTPTAVLVNSGSYTWTCESPDGGTDAQCSADNPKGPETNCLTNIAIPPQVHWDFRGSGYQLGVTGDDYFESIGQCGVFQYTIQFDVIDPAKITSFLMNRQGWDDIMEVRLNGQIAWHSRNGEGPWTKYGRPQCELGTSWKRGDTVDFKPYLQIGNNTLTLIAWVQGGGEAWIRGDLQGTCPN